MRSFVFSAALCALSAANHSALAQSSDFRTSCSKGGDTRLVQIVTPGKVGARCDVVVRYGEGSSATTRTPYHANNSFDFCTSKANDLVAGLAADGFSCGQQIINVTSQAAPPEPVAEEPAEPARETPVPERGAAVSQPEPEKQLSAEMNEILTQPTQFSAREEAPAQPAPQPAVQPAAQPVTQQRAAQTAPQPASRPAVETVQNEAAATPVAQPEKVVSNPVPAVRGPEDLTAGAQETVRGGERKFVVGRIVGAEPRDPEPAVVTPVKTAAQPATQNTPQRVASLSGTPQERLRSNETASRPLRSAADTIRATLDAQAAAWNEGNLDAFMETYWKDASLKFVSGQTISTGWSDTLKRYRKRYSDGSGLGRLGFKDMDVELVTDDVAIVTGRFNLVRNDQLSDGLFSLVMRQEAGVWRIVHDHTTPARRAAANQ